MKCSMVETVENAADLGCPQGAVGHNYQKNTD